MLEKPIVGRRIQQLRKEQKMTQGKLARELSNYIGTATPIAVSTVSQWELENKNPGYENIMGIADYFDVSVDYLLGRTSERRWENGNNSFKLKDNIIEISYEELSVYDGRPIYFISDIQDCTNVWSVYDALTNCLSCKQYRIKAAEQYKYFTFPLEEDFDV